MKNNFNKLKSLYKEFDNTLESEDFSNAFVDTLLNIGIEISENIKEIFENRENKKIKTEDEMLDVFKRFIQLYKVKGLNLLTINELEDKIIEKFLKSYQKNIVKLSNHIFLPGNACIEESNNKDKTKFEKEPKRADKFGILLKLLLQQGVNMGDIFIYEESLEKTRMRNVEYKILYFNIKGQDKTVLISDEIGQITFVYQGLIDYNYFDKINKGEVGDNIVGTINFGENYSDKLLEFLLEKNLNKKRIGKINIDKEIINKYGLKQFFYYRSKLESYKEMLEEKSNIYFEKGIWYFGDAKGSSTWSYLKNFPKSGFNKENKIGGYKGDITSVKDLKKMFKVLGFKVATEKQEKVRWRKYVESLENELKDSANIYKKGKIWYFGDAKSMDNWKKLVNFPNGKFNKKNGIGNDRGAIQKTEQLKKMFKVLGLKVATQEQEKIRWGKVLEGYEVKLRKDSNIYKEKGIWYFGDAKGSGTWSYIQYFPNFKFNKENKIGNENGVIQNSEQLKKMFKVLGLKVATQEQEKIRWGKILEGYEVKLKKESNIYKENGIWYFGDAKWNGTWNYIQHFPNSKFNREKKIGNKDGVILNPVQLKKMFKVLGLRVATEQEEKLRWGKYIESLEDELREKANIYREDGIWYFGKARACGTWKKLQSFPNGSFNRDNKIGDDKGIIQNPVQLKKMFRVLGLRVATKKEEEKRNHKKKS